MLYKDLVTIADKYYDMVLVDLEKTLKADTTRTLLETSHLIVTDFTQNYKQFEEYFGAISANKNIFKKSLKQGG